MNIALVTVVVAILLAWWGDHYRMSDHLEQLRLKENRRRSALANLSECADVIFDESGDPKEVFFHPLSTSDDDLRNLQYLPTIRKLTLAYCHGITDSGVKYLIYLPRLEVLYFYPDKPKAYDSFGTPNGTGAPRITNKSLDYILQISSLQELIICKKDFTEGELAKLRESLPRCHLVASE